MTRLRYLTAGESHGPRLTAVIEGLPAGMALSGEEIDYQLARRQKGYGRGKRMAIERDRVEVLSGLRGGRTLGSPLTLQVKNKDWENWREEMDPFQPPRGERRVVRPRPGHADLAGGEKYRAYDLRNILERASARETAMRVAVGAVARQLLSPFGCSVYSHVVAIGEIEASRDDALPSEQQLAAAENSPLRCLDNKAEAAMRLAIDTAREQGDTLGGIFQVLVFGLPPGLGSHVFPDRRLDGRLAAALMSVPAVKGVEIGLGFASARLPGSRVHDPFAWEEGSIKRLRNGAGGVEGGITTGELLVLTAAMKPIPTLMHPLPSVNLATGATDLGDTERSDVCAVPAAAVVGEAVVAWELARAWMEKFGGDSWEELSARVQLDKQQRHQWLQNWRRNN